MYLIKQIAEDFVVTELFEAPMDAGTFHYYILNKKNMTTRQAIDKIAKAHRIVPRHIGFAGNKDKHAVTQQVISIKGRHVQDWADRDLSIRFIGSAKNPVSLGDNAGNHFKITVRNILAIPSIHDEFINYFGEQRFSTNNAQVGKLIIKKDFARAAELLAEQGHSEIIQFLEKNPTNSIGALQSLPKKLLKFMVHAYQSALWNRIVQKITTDGVAATTVPLVGFGSIVPPSQKEYIDYVLTQEEITARDFIVRAVPYVSSEGTFRQVTSTAKNIEVGSLENDELHENMKKVTISFDLLSGCYATEFIRQNFSE
jgi:tRNA pseudouridine13 synthase